MIHWIAPLLIGIYLGILIDLPLRSWVASTQWERQAREAPPRPIPESIREDGSFDQDLFAGDSFDRDFLDQDWLADTSPDVRGTRRSGHSR